MPITRIRSGGSNEKNTLHLPTGAAIRQDGLEAASHRRDLSSHNATRPRRCGLAQSGPDARDLAPQRGETPPAGSYPQTPTDLLDWDILTWLCQRFFQLRRRLGIYYFLFSEFGQKRNRYRNFVLRKRIDKGMEAIAFGHTSIIHLGGTIIC